MSALPNLAEQRVANWLAGVATTAPVLPYKLVLLTVLGSDTAFGTEVVGGSYARPTLTLAVAALDAVDDDYYVGNSALVRIENMPAGDIVGAALLDSAATPFRWFHGPLATTRTLLAGDPVEFAANTITFKLR
jgi:hypothetical protein